MRIWRVYPLKRSYPTNTMIRPSSFIAPDNAKLFHFHIKFTIVCEKSPYNHLVIMIVIIISSVVYLLCKKHIIVARAWAPDSKNLCGTDRYDHYAIWAIVIVLWHLVGRQNYVRRTRGSVGTNYIFYLQ